MLGKDTIKKEIIKRMNGVETIPSYTTRPQREGDIVGKTYIFISKEEFESKRQRISLLRKQASDAYRDNRDYAALRTGSLLFLNELQDVICYGRFDDTDQFVIAVNSGGSEREFDVPVWRLGLLDNPATMVSLIISTENEYSIAARVYNVKEGFVHLTLYPYSSIVIKNMAI